MITKTDVASAGAKSRAVVQWLEAAVQFIDCRPRFILGSLIAFYLGQAVFLASQKRFWFDEILGLTGATVAHWSDILPTIARGLDYNPPLYYFAIRGSVWAFGDGQIAVRLPSILGMLCFLVCLYRFTLRRSSPIYAAVAFMFPLILPVRNYAYEARSYGMALGLLGLALVAYQRVTGNRERRLGMLFVMAFPLALAPLIHYYAILLVCPFFAAEFCRAWVRRCLDFPVLMALSAPAVSLIWAKQVAAAQRANLHTETFDGRWADVPNAYNSLFTIEAWVVILALLTVAVLAWMKGARDERLTPKQSPWPLHELIAVLILVGMPVIGMAVAMKVTHMFVPRHFVAALAGLNILLVWVCQYLFRDWLIAPAALVSLFLGVAVINTPRLASYFQRIGSDLVFLQERDTSGEPIVMEDAKDLLFAWRNNPALRTRAWFVADPAEALRRKNWDADDIAMLAMKDVVPLHVAKYEEFVHAHRHFYLYAKGNAFFGWITEALLDRHARLRLATTVPGVPVGGALYSVELDQ
jgi:hypothetical protein